YNHLPGRGAGYSLTTNKHHTLVGGTLEGRAKIWEINPRQGDLVKAIDLGKGLVRSMSFVDKNRLCVAIEEDTILEIRCLNLSGKMHWNKRFYKSSTSKSSLLTTDPKLVLLAFDGTSVAFDSLGKTLWQNDLNQVRWHGLYQRSNGAVLLFGRRYVDLFGDESEDAFIVSVQAESGQNEWFRHFGNQKNLDESCQLIERPNEQILFVSKQNQQLRFIELSARNSIGRIRYFGDSLPGLHYQAAGILNQSAWQDQLLFVYNRSDGTVWLQPNYQQEPPDHTPTQLGFQVSFRDSAGIAVWPTPVREVPTTFQLNASYRGPYTLHFKNVLGEGYAYLLKQDHRGREWQDMGWVQLGSQDSLLVSTGSEPTRYLLVVASRPFADPVGLVQQSAAFRADSLQPASYVPSLAAYCPDTFGDDLVVKVSRDGGRIDIKNLPPHGWVPLLLTFRNKNPRNW
ncbi:MAG: hypothetical protein KKG00_11090, partial [Bacteroidetes bacterium]|nr:hypothetical protein [Bacteroidota bacterium]